MASDDSDELEKLMERMIAEGGDFNSILDQHIKSKLPPEMQIEPVPEPSPIPEPVPSPKYDDLKYKKCGTYKFRDEKIIGRFVKIFMDEFSPKDWATLAFLMYITDFKVDKHKVELEEKSLLSLMNQRKLICISLLVKNLQLILPKAAVFFNDEIVPLYTAEDIALDKEFEPLILDYINKKCTDQKPYPSPITTYQNRYEIVRGLGQSLSDEKFKKICDRYASEYRLTTVELNNSFSIYQIIQILFENDDFQWDEFISILRDVGVKTNALHFT